MINSLEIQNFQSHRKTKLEFHPGVNIIVGASDRGKSAVFKALRWIVTNRPTGADFRSWEGIGDGGPTVATAETEEGTVTRKKGKGEEYTLTLPEGEPISFKAFRTDVPDEISSLLSITDINIQSQLDSHFLLSKSSGEVASYFNRIAKLDKIDLGIQNTQKEIRRLTQDISYQRTTKVELQQQLTKFEYLDKIEAQIEVLEENEKKRVNLLRFKLRLQHVCEQIDSNNKEMETYQLALDVENSILTVLNYYEEKDKKNTEYQKLEILIKNIKRVKKKIKETEQDILLELPIVTLLQLYKEQEEAESKRKSLDSIITSIVNVNTRIIKTTVTHKELTEKFNKEFSDICPLCNQKVK